MKGVWFFNWPPGPVFQVIYWPLVIFTSLGPTGQCYCPSLLWHAEHTHTPRYNSCRLEICSKKYFSFFPTSDWCFYPWKYKNKNTVALLPWQSSLSVCIYNVIPWNVSSSSWGMSWVPRQDSQIQAVVERHWQHPLPKPPCHTQCLSVL